MGEFTVTIRPEDEGLVEINGVEKAEMTGVQSVRLDPSKYGRGFYI